MEVVRGVYQITIPLHGVAPIPATDKSPENKIIKARRQDFVKVIEKDIVQSFSTPYVNVYLIEGTKGNLLIDTGWNAPGTYSALSEELKNYGFEAKGITHIVITHIHPDHYGLSGRIKQISGAEIMLSEIDAKFIDSRYINMDPLLNEMRKFFHSHGIPNDDIIKFSETSLPARQFVMPVEPDVRLKAGKKVSMPPFEFKVFETPGHSSGHICLYEPSRKLLFCGDHILPEITPNIAFHPQSGENPLAEYLESLKELMKLEVNLVFPGHGPAFSGFRGRVEELLRHHEQRSREMLNKVSSELKTAYQIATEIPWMTDVNPVKFQNLDSRNQRLALMETIAHLQFLVKRGEIIRDLKDDIYYYWA